MRPAVLRTEKGQVGRIKSLRVVRPPRRDRACGLIAHVSFVLGGLRIDGVAARKTRRGRFALSYPCHLDRRGRAHPYGLPVDRRLRQALERAVLAELGLEATR